MAGDGDVNQDDNNHLATNTQEMELIEDGGIVNTNSNSSRFNVRTLLVKFFGPPSIRVLQSIALSSFILAFITISLLSYLVANDHIDLSFGYGDKDVSDMSHVLFFTLQWQILPITFLFHFIFHLGFKRFRTVAWNPLDGHEDVTLADSKILLNTLEQTVLTIGVQLILVTHLEAQFVLKVIPFMNITFITGRILFWIGYPKFRHFGFCFSMIPSFMAIKYIWFEIIGLNKFIRNNFF